MDLYFANTEIDSAWYTYTWDPPRKRFEEERRCKVAIMRAFVRVRQARARAHPFKSYVLCLTHSFVLASEVV